MSTITEATQFYAANPAAQQADMAVLQSMLARSATDPAFRQQLLTDPRAAVSEFTGREVSESVNVVFIENQADATFVLPPAVAADAELSESELEAVAGGSELLITFIGVTVGIGAYKLLHDMAAH
ncbi:MAG TPA: NHLP leader peptide family RiPP precursor [Longimicrobium sp.]|nr:NHLP leader peptide family RiPP precursor [Longimicrobium sp.]